MKFLKNILLKWPFVAAVLVAAMRIDSFVVPALIGFGLKGTGLFLSAGLIAVFMACFWYWFWGWFVRLTGRLGRDKLSARPEVKEGIVLGKKAVSAVKEQGVMAEIQNFVLKMHDRITDPESKILKRVKRGSIFTMFFLGLCPWGTRTASIALCSFIKFKKGFLMVVLGTLTYVAFVAGIWSAIISVFK